MFVHCFSIVLYVCPLFLHSPLSVSIVSPQSSMFVHCLSVVPYVCPLFLPLSRMFVQCFSITLCVFFYCFSIVLNVNPVFLHGPLCLSVLSPWSSMFAHCFSIATALYVCQWELGQPNFFFGLGVLTDNCKHAPDGSRTKNAPNTVSEIHKFPPRHPFRELRLSTLKELKRFRHQVRSTNHLYCFHGFLLQ